MKPWDYQDQVDFKSKVKSRLQKAQYYANVVRIYDVGS